VTVIKINAITVPEDSGDELARRFAARAGAVDDQDGFEGFELLKPTDDRTTWLVITRWRDESAFDAWVSSPAFAHGHRGDSGGSESGGGHPGGDEGGGHPGGGHPGGESGGHPGGQAPVAMSAELWSYEVAGGSTPGA
jgi:heme oxygenase (mycobilin-producing)